MDFKDQMIEAYERGDCSYEGAYDHVRESMADAADARRKADKENPPLLSPEKREQALRREEERLGFELHEDIERDEDGNPDHEKEFFS